MIDKFLLELQNNLKKNNIEDDSIVESYTALYEKYISLGQSEFDIIRHFGEPSDIVEQYQKTNELPIHNMEEKLDFVMPTYLEEKPKEEVKTEKKEENTAPTTKAGLIMNDIFFVGLGLLFALAGCIALLGVSIFMTAGSIVQMKEVWELATKSQQIGGFCLALLAFIISVFFYFLVAWIVKVCVKFMKKYVKDHKENWNKCKLSEENK